MYFFINEKYKIKWRSLSTYRSFSVFDALIKNTLADLPVLVFGGETSRICELFIDVSPPFLRVEMEGGLL